MRMLTIQDTWSKNRAAFLSFFIGECSVCCVRSVVELSHTPQKSVVFGSETLTDVKTYFSELCNVLLQVKLEPSINLCRYCTLPEIHGKFSVKMVSSESYISKVVVYRRITKMKLEHVKLAQMSQMDPLIYSVFRFKE